MRFLELAVEHFNRFKEPFRLNLDNQGLVLVEGENRDQGGSNGAGKSLVWEALLWCLYGKMPRYGDRPVTSQACHPVNGANVSVTVLVGESVYAIRRSRTTKGSLEFKVQVAPLVSWGMIGDFEPYTRLSRDPGRRADDVTDLLGFDYAAMKAAIILGRGSDLPGAPFASQMSVLESILRLKDLGVASDIARRHLSAAERDHAVAKSALQTHEAVYVRAQADVQAAQARMQDGSIQADQARVTAELADAESYVTHYDDLQQLVTRAQSDLHRAQSAVNDVAVRVSRAAERQQELERQLSKSVCPTCGRPWEKVDLTVVRKKVKEAQAEVTKAQADRDKVDQKYQVVAHKATQLDEEFRRVQRVRDRLPGLRETLRGVQALHDELQRQVAAAELRAGEAHQQVDHARGRMEALHCTVARTEFWVDAYGRDGLQAEIFASAVPVLNHAAAAASQSLTQGAIEVAVNPMRERATEDLIRLGGTEAPTYDGLSSGQRQRVLLILALALRALARWRLPEAVNLSVFDEVFSNVDDLGMEAVVTLLREETSIAKNSSTFVVTHSDEFRKLFPGAKVVRVVRENGLATVHA